MTTGNKNRTTLELRDYSGVTGTGLLLLVGTGLLLLLELQDYSRVAGPTGNASKTYRNCRNNRTYKHYVIRLTGTTEYRTYYRNYRIQDLLQELLQELLQDLQEYACKEIFTLRMTWTCGMGGV